MPKPTCVHCGRNDSLLWRSAENGQICNECHISINVTKEVKVELTAIKLEKDDDKQDHEDKNGKEGETTPAKATGKGTRKSTRATRYKPKTPAPTPAKTPAPRGRGRRSIFKRQPFKAPTATATVVTSDSIFYKGNYMQVGDIVSMIDIDGGTYYAQIRGFMTDQYCEKSAVVTWLLPTKASPPPDKGFDPATYIIGPEEELPRKLEVMEFVMHAPSNFKMFESLIGNIKRRLSKTSEDVGDRGDSMEKSGFKRSLHLLKKKLIKPEPSTLPINPCDNLALSPRAIGLTECAQMEIEWPTITGATDNNPNVLEKFTRIVTITNDDRNYQRKSNDREEIRRRLAMGADSEEFYSMGHIDRPGRKPSLHSRLQNGKHNAG